MKSRARVLLPVLASVLATSMSCKPEEDPETHGFVCVEIRTGLGSASDPAALYAGTTHIKVTVNYLGCLQEFYENTHTEYAQNGVEGEAVFAEWMERMCSETYNGRAECTVTDIRQDLSTAKNLTITYAINDANAIQNRRFLVAPLPLEEFAGCKPDVKVSGDSAVSGYNAEGGQIWNIEAFNETVEARATLGGGGCIPVDVGPP